MRSREKGPRLGTTGERSPMRRARRPAGRSSSESPEQAARPAGAPGRGRGAAQGKWGPHSGPLPAPPPPRQRHAAGTAGREPEGTQRATEALLLTTKRVTHADQGLPREAKAAGTHRGPRAEGTRPPSGGHRGRGGGGCPRRAVFSRSSGPFQKITAQQNTAEARPARRRRGLAAAGLRAAAPDAPRRLGVRRPFPRWPRFHRASGDSRQTVRTRPDSSVSSGRPCVQGPGPVRGHDATGTVAFRSGRGWRPACLRVRRGGGAGGWAPPLAVHGSLGQFLTETALKL